jgi:predicted dehydrogenase
MSFQRREFIKTGAGAAIGASLWPGRLVAAESEAQRDTVRLGFVGVGGRGTWLMRLALQRDDCEVKAVCDVKPERVERAQDMVDEERGRRPRGFSDGEEDFLNLVERNDIDAVIIATPWLWHTPVAVAAMKSGKWVGTEVPAAVTIQECWDLVNTSEETGMPCMIMENVCFRRDVMAVLNMVRQGVFGELMHCHCGVGPVAKMLNINSGNRFVTLTSTATKTRGLHNYIVDVGGEDHPNADVEFKLGDIVTTVIKCANGETVVVSHDTNLPRPYSLMFRVQGTKGLWMNDGRTIYIEGVSPESHRWEDFGPYGERYDHPLWKRYEDSATGSGHGGMDFFVMNAFVEAVKRGVEPPIDVYDAAAWSVISPLSEQSIATGSAPVRFPDFTRGKWVTRTKIFGLSDEF